MSLDSYFPLTSLSSAQLCALLPIFILSFGALFSLIGGASKAKGHGIAFSISLVTLVASLVASYSGLSDEATTILDGTLNFTLFNKSVALMSLIFALFGIVLTYGQDEKEGLLAEVYALILFSTAGMILMMSTTHLLFMFIALEIMSLAIYVLVSMRRTSRFSAEAGLKYFILGGLASAMFLYGSSLLFGASGSFDLAKIQQFVMNQSSVSPLYYVGLGLIVAAMLFKVGAVPFHGWLPDVYQGASTNVTGFMGAAVKFTAFIAFARISHHLIFASKLAGASWFTSLIWLVSAASMIYGNFVAISQTEIKRMLSFSTIAHTGYLLLGLYTIGLGNQSFESIVLYLFFYALANLGAFAVISAFEDKNQKDLTLDGIAGLGMKHPVMGTLFTIFLLSMAGIPLTSGFIGKYGLFSAAVSAGEIPLVVIAVLTSVVSVYYYLRVIVYLFMKESTTQVSRYHNLKGASFAAIISAAATIQLGIFPKAIIQFVKMISK